MKLHFNYQCFYFYTCQLFNHPSFDIIILVTISSLGLLNIFLYCYFGKLATESFEEMSNSLYESNWYKLPIKQQKYILLMMVNAKRPLYYHGFGIVILNLETFCNVRKIHNCIHILSVTLFNFQFFYYNI